MGDGWRVQIKGKECSPAYEISVIHATNTHGQISWGWFNETKLLVLHNGGPCDWPVCKDVWDAAVASATKLAAKLNGLGVDSWPIRP